MAEDRVLYEDSNIKITTFPKDPESHELHFKRGNTYLLQRGILKELSRTPLKKLKGKLDNLNPEICFVECRDHSICPNTIGWAIGQARITEVENERDYWIGQAREERRWREGAEESKDRLGGSGRLY
jgi:hypothetical protein